MQPTHDSASGSKSDRSKPDRSKPGGRLSGGLGVLLAAAVLVLSVPMEAAAQRSRDASSTRSSSGSSSSSVSSGRSSSSSSSGSRTVVSRGSSDSSRSSGSNRVGSGSSGHRDADRDRLSGRRGNRSSRGSGGYYGGGYYGGYYGGGYGGYGYGGYYHPYYGHYYPSFRLHYYPYPYYYPMGWGAYGVRPYRAEHGAPGALDLNVKPGKAEVYLDGQLIGPVDRYDGFPSYLWLEPGTYDVAFYRPGFETLVLQYKVYPGLVVRVDERMIPGEAVHPSSVSPYSEGPYSGGQMSYRSPEEGEVTPAPRSAGPESSSTPATLRLDVSPSDTSIYVDGRFVGSAGELSEIELPAGEHRVELVRPGHEPKSVTLEVGPGEAVDLRMALTQQAEL